MDGETARALIAALMWQAGTADQRLKKPVTGWLVDADRLLLASYDIGAPLAPDATLTLRPDAYSAQRLKEWLTTQPLEIQALFRAG